MLYTPDARTLDIVFRHGKGTYRYFDVSAAEWRAFKRAPSKGTYLNAVFKARHPRFEQLTVVGPAVVWRMAAGGGTPRDLPDENVWGFYENSL